MHTLICANCQGQGKLACKNCLLVLYCGTPCQRDHWTVHKRDCRSPLIRHNWKPNWQVEDRPPLFMGGPRFTSFGRKKYLWGNMPAIDILRLDVNEGVEYAAELRLLFAASGDLRNVVKTIASVPESFTHKISVTLNDKDFDVVSRNAILLLVAFVAESAEQAVDCIIHVWYSAMISQDHIRLLHGPVRELVKDVCSKITSKAPGTVLGKTWQFGSSSLRLVLTKEQWSSLLACFTTPESLTVDRAQQIRTSITLAHERRDHRERSLFVRLPVHRLCATRFREDGMLLPFGQSRAPFDQPNPTFFQAEDWPLKDSADPLDGWSFADISTGSYGPATNDVYGRMYRYLDNLIASFLCRLKSPGISFQLFNVDAQKLDAHLQDNTFARVEVSNISDNWCLGAASTVAHLGRFLQPSSMNPHATLLSLFMNAVDEEMTRVDEMQSLMAETNMVSQYVPLTAVPQSNYDPSALMRDAARPLVRDTDKYFNRYMEKNRFKDIEQFFGFVTKDHHTIIDKWPLRLKKRPKEEGAEEEFKVLMASAHCGNERYVEWRRKL